MTKIFLLEVALFFRNKTRLMKAENKGEKLPEVTNADVMRLLKKIGAKDITSELRGQTFIMPNHKKRS